MSIIYEVQQDYNTVKATTADGTEFFIPMDLSNSDYQAYLASVSN